MSETSKIEKINNILNLNVFWFKKMPRSKKSNKFEKISKSLLKPFGRLQLSKCQKKVKENKLANWEVLKNCEKLMEI